MNDMADKIGKSNVVLKKRLLAFGLSIQPQGYWNKLRTSRAAPPVPRIPARGLGVADPVMIPDDFRPVIAGVGAGDSDDTNVKYYDRSCVIFTTRLYKVLRVRAFTLQRATGWQSCGTPRGPGVE